jgi:diaminopimelate epimerase
MMIQITKMNGTKNTFFILDGINQDIATLDLRECARTWCHKDLGLGKSKGADGLAVILASDTADIRMQIINADGSEPEMCGNAIRCVAWYAFNKGLLDHADMSIESGSGLKHCVVQGASVRVNMGAPALNKDRKLSLMGQGMTYVFVSMGNPHAVLFVDKVSDFPVREIGPVIEHHTDFEKGTNVEFIQYKSKSEIEMRVWERGVGETLSCGTGACAAVVAGVATGVLSRKVVVHLRGGDLQVEWDEASNDVFMTGATECEEDVSIVL